MSPNNTLQKLLTIAAFIVLSLGSIAYAIARAPAIVRVDLTHIDDKPEVRDLIGGRAPDYSVRVHYNEDIEESLILENQSAAKTLSLSLPGEKPAEWATEIEILEHDGPLNKQIAIIQPIPTDTNEVETAGYRIRWERELRAEAALKGFLRTPAGILLLLVMLLIAIRIVLIFG